MQSLLVKNISNLRRQLKAHMQKIEQRANLKKSSISTYSSALMKIIKNCNIYVINSDWVLYNFDIINEFISKIPVKSTQISIYIAIITWINHLITSETKTIYHNQILGYQSNLSNLSNNVNFHKTHNVDYNTIVEKIEEYVHDIILPILYSKYFDDRSYNNKRNAIQKGLLIYFIVNCPFLHVYQLIQLCWYNQKFTLKPYCSLIHVQNEDNNYYLVEIYKEKIYHIYNDKRNDLCLYTLLKLWEQWCLVGNCQYVFNTKSEPINKNYIHHLLRSELGLGLNNIRLAFSENSEKEENQLDEYWRDISDSIV